MGTVGMLLSFPLEGPFICSHVLMQIGFPFFFFYYDVVAAGSFSSCQSNEIKTLIKAQGMFETLINT